MGGIFISYRRSDVSGYAHALQAQLERRLGPDQLFIDVDSIKPGQDFIEEIEKALDSSSVLLVLIGKRWLQPERLQDPHDFVRLEIALAIEQRKRIIPVLLEGATMPKPEDLPDPIRPLTRRQAFEISDLRFNSDTERLIDLMIETAPEPVPPPAPLANVSPETREVQPQPIMINSHRRHAVALMPTIAVFFDGMTSSLLLDSSLKGTIQYDDLAFSVVLGAAALFITWALVAQSKRNYFSFRLACLIVGAQAVATALSYTMMLEALVICGIPLLIYLTFAWRWRNQPFKMNS